MKRFCIILMITVAIFFGFMCWISTARADKNPFKQEEPVIKFEAPKAYTGHYLLKGKFGPNDMLADGLNVLAPSCYKDGLAHKSSFTIENRNGVAVINETELKDDNLFSFSTMNDGVRIGHMLIKHGRMRTLRFLELKRHGNTVVAEGHFLKIDTVSGETYCSNTLKMRGIIKGY